MMGPKKREGIGQNVLGHRRQTDTALHTIYWGCCAGCVYISLEAHRGARIGTSLLAAAAPWLLCVFLYLLKRSLPGRTPSLVSKLAPIRRHVVANTAARQGAEHGPRRRQRLRRRRRPYPRVSCLREPYVAECPVQQVRHTHRSRASSKSTAGGAKHRSQNAGAEHMKRA